MATFEECLSQGKFTDAYATWNKTAEDHLALQIKTDTLPSKCRGKGNISTLKTQTLAAIGTYRIEAGAATAWRLRLSRSIRKCLELEARITNSFQQPLVPGTDDHRLAKKLHTYIVYSGRLILARYARTTEELPPPQHTQALLLA